jgi:hypothetical protein
MADAAAPLYSVRQVLDRGLEARRISKGRKQTSRQVTIFKKHFGSHPYQVARVWRDLVQTDIPEAKINPKKESLDHLFIALHFLRCYNDEEQNAKTFNCDVQTARKWQWIFVKKLSALKQLKIFWPDNWYGAVFIISVDGTHCSVFEPIDPIWRKAKRWFSKKLNGPGVNYEIALHI